MWLLARISRAEIIDLETAASSKSHRVKFASLLQQCTATISRPVMLRIKSKIQTREQLTAGALSYVAQWSNPLLRNESASIAIISERT